jgi:hypothetical protein
LSALDPDIRAACDAGRTTYSSWVDDLAFSGNTAPAIIELIIKALKREGFSVSHRKIKIMGPGDRKVLNNLVLGRFITVRAEYVASIRAGIHNLKCGRVPLTEVNAYFLGLEGSIGYLRLFDPTKAGKLSEQLGLVREVPGAHPGRAFLAARVKPAVTQPALFPILSNHRRVVAPSVGHQVCTEMV